jgi:hypothetical protein
VLAPAGWIGGPHVQDWWLVRTACDGVLPSGLVRELAAGGGHFTKAEVSARPRLGDNGCGLYFKSHGEAKPVVRITACTGQDDQNAEFHDAFLRQGFPRMSPMPQGLPPPPARATPCTRRSSRSSTPPRGICVAGPSRSRYRRAMPCRRIRSSR